jgi:hypothetical protein
MAEAYPPFVGAYVPSTQDVVLHIPRRLWEVLPRTMTEAGPVGELVGAVWATPGLDAALGHDPGTAPPPPEDAAAPETPAAPPDEEPAA